MATNRMAVLAARPVGNIKPGDFAVKEAPVPALGADEMLVRVKAISLDPAMRGWVQDVKSYLPPVQIGEVMRAGGAGVVEASNNPRFKPGDAVTGVFGVQQYAVSDGKGVAKVDTSIAPLERWIGGLGMPGMTAYFGLLDVGQPKEGETVVVSAAAGAVGSIVGQIAKIKGCRVVGIAGGKDKCDYVVNELGFDACVDYKAGNLRQQLKAACPNGIDVNFENVGGEILDTILPMMNLFGRIAICGLISEYNATSEPPGMKNFRVILVRRLRVQGLIVFDWAKRYHEGVADLVKWSKEGKLKLKEDVREGGIDAFAETVNLLFTGGNFGKLVLRV
jgi:NADPH-dependent curcumin reductase CurA